MNLVMARATIEALIFASSEPVTAQQISNIIGINEHTVKQLIVDLITEFHDSKRGIQICEVANGYQFGTHPECAPYLEKLQKVARQTSLSQAAIETLAIIAYKQPITKAEIETLRGVRIESALTTLVEKSLIEESGRKDVPGRPILYGTTANFLKHFGLTNLSELPSIPEWVNNQEASMTENTETAEENEDA